MVLNSHSTGYSVNVRKGVRSGRYLAGFHKKSCQTISSCTHSNVLKRVFAVIEAGMCDYHDRPILWGETLC